MTKAKPNRFDRGMKAYIRGRRFDQNPYSRVDRPVLRDQTDWDAGWIFARNVSVHSKLKTELPAIKDDMPMCNIEFFIPSEDDPMKFEIDKITEFHVDKKCVWIEKEEGWNKAVPSGIVTITITGRLVSDDGG